MFSSKLALEKLINPAPLLQLSKMSFQQSHHRNSEQRKRTIQDNTSFGFRKTL